MNGTENQENRDKRAHLKRRCTWNRKIVLIILMMLLGTALAFIVDYEAKNQSLQKELLLYLEAVSKFSGSFFPNDNGYIMDAFGLIWGMTVTLVLFLMEFHNTYWYGVTLRNIVNLSLNKSVLVLSASVYILLCPLVYLAENFGFYAVALWGIVCTFFIFTMIPICIFYVTGRTRIIELLNHSTIDQMRKKVREENGVPIRKDGIQIELEELSITSMIEHLEYEDIAEVRRLLETLADLFVNQDILGLIQNTMYEHSVIMSWADKIITKSGTETDDQCKRTLYIVDKLWEKITEYILEITKEDKNEARRDTLMLSCLVELLLPLIGLGTEQSEKVFWGVWKKIRYDRGQALLYLFLYVEYLHYEQINFSSHKSYTLFDRMCLNKKELEEACKIWNQDLAMEFWLCWTVLWDSDGNIAISFFLDFCGDVEYIAAGNLLGVRTPTMRRITLRMEE